MPSLRNALSPSDLGIPAVPELHLSRISILSLALDSFAKFNTTSSGRPSSPPSKTEVTRCPQKRLQILSFQFGASEPPGRTDGRKLVLPSDHAPPIAPPHGGGFGVSVFMRQVSTVGHDRTRRSYLIRTYLNTWAGCLKASPAAPAPLAAETGGRVQPAR